MNDNDVMSDTSRNWPQGEPKMDKWLHRYFRICFRLVGLRYMGWETLPNGEVSVHGAN